MKEGAPLYANRSGVVLLSNKAANSRATYNIHPKFVKENIGLPLGVLPDAPRQEHTAQGIPYGLE